MLKKKLLITALLLPIISCTTGNSYDRFSPESYGLREPTQHELENADYGEYPENYKEVIENHMKFIFFDPESARYEYLDDPMQGWYPGKADLPPKFGYKVLVSINAKNRYGGYTGWKLYSFLIKDGKVIDSK